MDNNVLLQIIKLLIILPFALMIYYGTVYNVFEYFVRPSFSLHPKRLIPLVISYYIGSLLILMVVEPLSHHLNIPINLSDNINSIYIPIAIYFTLRCITRMHSSRVAKEHVNIISLIIFISYIVGYIINGVYYPKTPDPKLIIYLGISALFIPLIIETFLSTLDKFPIIEKYVIKNKKLIDLTDELPVSIRFISRATDIENKIEDLIKGIKGKDDPDKSILRIITNGYTTITENLELIKKRNAITNDNNVRIIGHICKECKSGSLCKKCRENQKKIKNFKTKDKLRVCQDSFDKIRMIIDGNNRLLVTFALSGYPRGHVGIYSEHPFVVSLFKNYFDTKCSNICDMLGEELCFDPDKGPPTRNA